MKIYIYGEKNSNVDIVLPYLTNQNFFTIPSDVLKIAISEKILKYGEDNKIVPGNRFALITEKFLKLKSESFKYINILKNNINCLKRTFKSTSLYKQGYTWDELQHIIVFGLCLDFGILRHLYKKGVIQNLKRKYYLWGFDSNIVGKNPFGIRLWLSKMYRLGFAELWNPQITIRNINLNDKYLDLFYKILNDYKLNDTDSKLLVLLKYYGLVEQNKNKYKILIPIIDQNEDNEFNSCIDKICLKIVEKVTLPVIDKYSSTPVFKHGIIRLLMEYCADLIIETKLVPPFNTITKPYQKNWLFTNLYNFGCIANNLDY